MSGALLEVVDLVAGYRPGANPARRQPAGGCRRIVVLLGPNGAGKST